MLCVRRREFITLLGGAAAWPLAASAQQSRRVPRIGVLLLGTPDSFAGRIEAFVEGLRDLGYVDGRTVAIEWKWGQDRADRLPNLAAELVRSQVDVIVTGGTPAAQALKNATRTIPIVMAIVGDPVAAGLVDSLARPGGNATGFSIVATDLSGRRLQLLKEMVPGFVFYCGDVERCQSAIANGAKRDSERGAELGSAASFGADFRRHFG
jgi:putative ABC transport system substrate-binding protein